MGHLPHIWVAGKTNQHLGWGVRLGSLAYTPPLPGAETGIGHPGYTGTSDGDEAQKEAWSRSQGDPSNGACSNGGWGTSGGGGS